MDPLTVLALVTKCIFGLEKIYQYSSEVQRAELNVLELTAECRTLEVAISKTRDLYAGNGPASSNSLEGVDLALANCEQQFRVLLDKLQPVLTLVEKPKPSKFSIRLRISATWKRNEIDFLRQSIRGQAGMVNFLLTALSYDSINKMREILESKEFQQLLKRSNNETESLSIAYDQESSLFRVRPTDHNAQAESIIDYKEFSFEPELLTGKAYRNMYARWKRSLFINDRDQAEAGVGSSEGEDGLDDTDQVESYEEALPEVPSDVVQAKDVTNVMKKFQAWCSQKIDTWEISGSYNFDSPAVLEAKEKRAEVMYSEIRTDVEAWRKDAGMNEEELRAVSCVTQMLAFIQERNTWPQ
ncbi:hypothetical protein B0T26DRAFT_750553 [Lasiosphaeria miniovina]|uniref:Fungal N-terminal domain-containing protein n=1 Tax=Lasiosphaeria miniovina TaxID=1954250 RepID=A0AA40AWH8_9PEZI|nr:uncharacterized protein B0T26DRAFT_750553 [Lasiosphaeria miniovina]KAK0723267.1 hypothetical protein B0T26DRAFT_750553 [Lasiosphaeria miniovina]